MIGALLLLVGFVAAVLLVYGGRLLRRDEKQRRADRFRARVRQLRRMADEQAREVAERIEEDKRNGGGGE